MDFCAQMGYPAVPATTESLCRYIAHLAEKLSYTSIPKYLSIIRLLHLECGLANPLDNNWLVGVLLRGVKKHLGAKVHQKLPITITMLLQMHAKLNLSMPKDSVFWAACLTMFFGMLRRSNVLAPNKGFVLGKHLARQDVHLCQEGVSLVIRWSKTIQYRERELMIPLPLRTDHPLCPSTAIIKALALTGQAPSSGPAFMTPSSKGALIPLTPEVFVQRVKQILGELSYDTQSYSGHSFRRGGATWAFNNHVPGEVIQVLGDWKSECYKQYIQVATSTKRKYIQNCVSSLP